MNSQQWRSSDGSSAESDRTDSWSSSASSHSSEDDDRYLNDHTHPVVSHYHPQRAHPVRHSAARRGVDDSRNSWSSNEPRLQFASDVPTENVVYDMLLAAEAARMVDVNRRKVLREEARIVASSHHLSARERDMIVYRLRKRLHGGTSPLDDGNDVDYIRGGTALSYAVHTITPGKSTPGSDTSSLSTISDTTTSSASPPMSSPEALDRYVASRRARHHRRQQRDEDLGDQVVSSRTVEGRRLLGDAQSASRSHNRYSSVEASPATANHADPHVQTIHTNYQPAHLSRSSSSQQVPEVKVITYSKPFSPFGSTVTRVGNDTQAVQRHLEGHNVEVALVPVFRGSSRSEVLQRGAPPSNAAGDDIRSQLDVGALVTQYRTSQRGSSPIVVEFVEGQTAVAEGHTPDGATDYPAHQTSSDGADLSQPSFARNSSVSAGLASSTSNGSASAAVEVVHSRLHQHRGPGGGSRRDDTEYDKRFKSSQEHFTLVDTLSMVAPEASTAHAKNNGTLRSTPATSRSTSTASTALPIEPLEAVRAARREQSVDAAVHVVTTVVAEVGCQHDPHFGARTTSTETSTVLTKSRGIDTDERRHVSVGVNVSSPRTSAQGTSTATANTGMDTSAHEHDELLLHQRALAAAAAARDVSPTPERSPPPIPTPHAAYAFLSPIPFKGLRGFPHSHPERKEFRGPITPLGRKTPPRERNHVNSPPHQRGGGARGISPSATATSRGSVVTRPADEAHDRRIALKCVKHAVFGDVSRSLDFREKTGMTLKEAREWYDAMCEGDCEWGCTGIYRHASSHPHHDVANSSRVDMLVQAAMTEVVRGGGCMDWSTWFAGISRRRVEEALERFSDAFAQRPKQYQWTTSTTYVVDSSSGGLLMRVPASRVDAVASVLY
jgi:hypothetical protein